MIRTFICLPVFLLFSLYGCKATQISQTDRDILHSFWEYASRHELDKQTIPERIPVIARFFLGTPYQSNTLDTNQEEILTINLHELDCVTFVENVLALAYLPEYSDKSIDSFIANILKIRYRNGKIEDYTSRLHYSSDWLYEMEQQHLLTDVTAQTGGTIYHPDVCFMSKNHDRYPPLQNDAQLLLKMKNIETSINQRTYHYIQKDRINELSDKVREGDVVLITTNIKGLDVSHLGFAIKQQGETFLLHASSSGKKVMISERPLQEYMQGISSQSGIIIARPSKMIP